MKLLNWLQANSNSFGHLVMSVFSLVFLALIVIIRRDALTVTSSISLMGILFGYWFGAQSTAIKHKDASDVVQAQAKVIAAEVTARARVVEGAPSLPVPLHVVVDTEETPS